jgi:hypothetical protein
MLSLVEYIVAKPRDQWLLPKNLIKTNVFDLTLFDLPNLHTTGCNLDILALSKNILTIVLASS